MAICASIAAARCGSGSTTLTAPSVQRCALTISPGTLTLDAAGGSGAVTVTTSRECQWTASASAPWIRLGTTSGQGPGTISYDVDPNRSTTPRNTVVAIGEFRATLTQRAASCPFSLTPSSIAIGPGGGEQTISLSTEDFCSWTAASDVPWVTVTRTAGNGSDELQVRVDANAGELRRGTLTVGDASLPIEQQARPVANPTSCAVTLAPSASSVTSAGGPITTSVSTGAGCTWTAVSNASWVKISGSGTGSGSGPATFSVDPNTGAARTGTVMISGVPFTVSQGGAAAPPPPPPSCTFSAAPGSFTNVAAAGATLDVMVTAPTGCAWTATSTLSWVAITQGASGSGDATVKLTVQLNSGVLRSGTVTVAGQPITVTQVAAASPCTFTVAPTSYNPPVAGGTTQIAVTTTSSCAWTVSGAPSWISATPSGATGNGNVSLTVQANTGAGRTATLTIAGQPVVVTQPSGLPACAYTINPSSFSNVAAAGGNISVAVTTTAGCAWSVSGNPAWVTASTVNGSGSGTTTITVQANTGALRTSAFTIAGQNFTVTQLPGACTYTVTPSSFNLPSGAQNKTITVSTQAGCPVQASSSDTSWLHITATPPAGGGDVDFTADRNDASTARTANVTISGLAFTQNVSVTQAKK